MLTAVDEIGNEVFERFEHEIFPVRGVLMRDVLLRSYAT
jgi:hypothetical protein